MHFRINEGSAVQEAFDGEVLAINLDTGTYYSMPGLSAQVWAWLIKSVPVDTIIQALNEMCDGDPATIATEVDAFIAKLQEHELIVPSEAPALGLEPARSQAAADRIPVSLPLDIHTDMQDILLLDPIHDVGESGWPTVASGTALDKG